MPAVSTRQGEIRHGQQGQSDAREEAEQGEHAGSSFTFGHDLTLNTTCVPGSPLSTVVPVLVTSSSLHRVNITPQGYAAHTLRSATSIVVLAQVCLEGHDGGVPTPKSQAPAKPVPVMPTSTDLACTTPIHLGRTSVS